MNMVNVTDSIVILKDAHNRIKISHFTDELTCRKCEITFGCKQSLKNHLLIHENQRQLKVVTNEGCDKDSIIKITCINIKLFIQINNSNAMNVFIKEMIDEL